MTPLLTPLLLFVFSIAPLQARATAKDPTPCRIEIGPRRLKLTFYQPDTSHAPFCDKLPAFGPTVIAFDVPSDGSLAQYDELRAMSLDIRLIRDTGKELDKLSLELNEEFHLPLKSLATGTVYFEHRLNRPTPFVHKQKYVLLAKLRKTDGQEDLGRFPFEIDEMEPIRGFIWPGVAWIAGAVSIVLGVDFWRRRKAPSAR